MSALDLPPGIGLIGTPLATFRAPPYARWLAIATVVIAIGLGVLTWYLVSTHWWRRGSSIQITLPVAFSALGALGFAVRHARLAVTRDGVRWGWSSLGFHQSSATIACAHIYLDGIALEARRGSWWFLAARDWAAFPALVRVLRRTALPLRDHDTRAPFRARRQSYGRFLDSLLLATICAAIAVAMWAR